VEGSDYLRESFNYSHSHLWRNFGILLGFVAFFTVTYLAGITYITSAQSKGSDFSLDVTSTSLNHHIKAKSSYLDEEVAEVLANRTISSTPHCLSGIPPSRSRICLRKMQSSRLQPKRICSCGAMWYVTCRIFFDFY
jgi:hypothetical protein